MIESSINCDANTAERASAEKMIENAPTHAELNDQAIAYDFERNEHLKYPDNYFHTLFCVDSLKQDAALNRVFARDVQGPLSKQIHAPKALTIPCDLHIGISTAASKNSPQIVSGGQRINLNCDAPLEQSLSETNNYKMLAQIQEFSI